MPTYSFNDVQASLVGPTGNLSLGYGASNADEGITLSPNGDKNTMKTGADGSGMHSLHAARDGTATVHLLKISPLNQALMAMYDAQTISASLHGKNTITVRQTAAGDITTCSECAFKKKPDLTYAKDGDIVHWVFDVVKMDSVMGTY
jgi:hypothetical protein